MYYLKKDISDENELDIYCTPEMGYSFVGLQSDINNGVCIYKVDTYKEPDKLVTVVQLADGDKVFSKLDGCTYTFDASTKTFINAERITVDPVLDFVNVVQSIEALPVTAQAGEKVITYYTAQDNPIKVYTATAQDTWDAGTNIALNARYASLTDKKIYEY